MRGRGTGGARDGRVVDVQPDAVRQVRGSGSEEGLRDVGGELGVDGLICLGGGGPGYLRAGSAAESDAWDALEGCLGGCTDSSRDQSCESRVCCAIVSFVAACDTLIREKFSKAYMYLQH